MVKLSKLTQEKIIKPFSCDDADLNNFLLDDSRNFARELLAVTYVLETDTDIIAYFSLLNDKVDVKEVKGAKRRQVDGSVPHPKRYGTYPAVKIGRLAVSSEFSNQGYGSKILDTVKVMSAKDNKTGCRYITVDAYAAAVSFYEKNGFKFLTKTDEGDDTRLMYFDLMAFNL